eukprot:SAG11_NODE_21378_length_426_cov_1.048930_2_plen_20_part_01
MEAAASPSPYPPQDPAWLNT